MLQTSWIFALTCSITGMACIWIGVGTWKPASRMFWSNRELILYSCSSCWNVAIGSGRSVPCTCILCLFRKKLIWKLRQRSHHGYGPTTVFDVLKQNSSNSSGISYSETWSILLKLKLQLAQILGTFHGINSWKTLTDDGTHLSVLSNWS